MKTIRFLLATVAGFAIAIAIALDITPIVAATLTIGVALPFAVARALRKPDPTERTSG